MEHANGGSRSGSGTCTTNSATLFIQFHNLMFSHRLKLSPTFSRSKNDTVAAETTHNGAGFVLVKDFRLQNDEVDDVVHEADSLNAIKTALKNLEDH